jgi:hypothetical protein
MAQDWIIDVLADLRQYAVRNYHLRLAEQLDDAIVVAAAELRAAETTREHPSSAPAATADSLCVTAAAD